MGTDSKQVPEGNPAMNSMLQAIQLFGGLKTTEKVSGDTSAIDSVLSQLQGQDFSGLLQSVFQQAAAKTPQLTTALANASGARTGGNSPLAAALQQVLQAATVQGQAQIASQQAQNLQTQAALAGQKAQASHTVQRKSNTATANAQRMLGGLQLANSASKLFTKKSLYDNIAGVVSGNAGGSSVAPITSFGLGTTPAVPNWYATDINLFPQSATAGDVTSAMSSLDAIADGSSSNWLNFNPSFTPDVPTSGIDFNPELSLTPVTDTSSFGIGDYLNKSPDIGDMDLSFSSDAGASAASGATTASQGTAEGINAASAADSASESIPWGSYLRAASYLDSSKWERISNDFSQGGWNDKVGDIADIAAIYFPPAALIHPAADAVDVAMTTFDDDLHKGIKGIRKLPNDIWSNIDTVANQKYNLVDGFFGAGTTAKYQLPRPSDAIETGRSLFDPYKQLNTIGSFVDDFAHNPIGATEHLAENISDRFAEVDDAAQGIINGVGNGVSHVGNTIGDAIADVFGW